MAVQFSKELLETFFAPGIDEINFAPLRDLKLEIPKWGWLQNHFLNSAFSARFDEKWRARFIVMAVRAKGALDAYVLARISCSNFVTKSIPGNPDIDEYFHVVLQFETVIHNLHQICDIFQNANGVDHQYDPREDAVRKIANRIKHAAEDFGSPEYSGLTIPMWLTSTGLKTLNAEVSFHDLAEMLVEVTSAVEEMQNPTEMLVTRRT